MSFSTATAVPYWARIGRQTMLRGATLGAMAQSVGIIIIIAAASRYVLDTFASILGPTSFAVQVPGTWRMSAAQADFR
jgi:hypothetical protein